MNAQPSDQVVQRFHDPAAESTLRQWVEECVSSSNCASGVCYSLGDRLRREGGTSLELLERCLKVALEPSFQAGLGALPQLTDEYDREALPSGIAREILSAVLDTTAHEVYEAVRVAMDQSSVAKLKDAVADARRAAKKLFDAYQVIDEEKSETLTLDDFYTKPWRLSDVSVRIACSDRISSGGGHALITIANAIQLGDFYSRILESYPQVDRQQLEIHRNIYGAKGAHLLALKDASEKLSQFLEKIGELFKVPDFTLIAAAESRCFRTNPEDSPSVQEAFQWAQGRSVMVRSSAVHSEDGEHLGAGVYASVLLPAGASFNVFTGARERPQILPPTEKLTHLRVVSNGLEARIYVPEPIH